MTNDGSKLRDALGRRLDDLQPSTPLEGIRRRARRGRLLTATSLVAVIAVIGASGALILDRSADDDTDRVVGPAPSPDEGLIAFTTQEAGEPMPWIATVPVSGGEVTRLREGSDPSWSPDGTRIAFRCYPGICTMKADGSDVVRLTNPQEPVLDEDPDWGPRGYIAFTRTPEDRSRDIYVIPEDGGNASPASPVIEQGANFAPSWSPDGRAIAFTRGEGPFLEAPKGGFQLWTLNIDGSELRQLTETGADRPDWSPDGLTITYDAGSVIWTIPAGGGEPRKLEPATTGEHPDVGAFPTWSPDSSRIAYMCEARGFGHNDLCVVNADGTGRTTILATPANEASPAWQPTDDATVMPAQATADAYPLAVRDGATYVFAPARGQPWGWCPQRAQPLETNDLPVLETLIATSADEISGGLNTEDAYANAVLASDAPGPPDFARMISKDCGAELVDRTMLVTLHLPRVDSASMGATTYFVSREPRGWVIWNVW